MAAPTDILLSTSPATIAENSANGTIIGVLSAVDADPTTYTWTMVDGAGGRFSLSGTNLIVANSLLLDFEQQNMYTVTIRVTESGVTFDKQFAISLVDVTGESITGSAGADTLTSASGNDSFAGAGGNDSLSAGDGNDTLDGGTGADTMSGGTGNDLFYVDNAGDVVIDEAFFGGTDTVQASVSYTLASYIENLTLTGSALNATGNSMSNVLTGTSAANVLDGKAGNDTMIGGAGNDTYYVDNASDVVQEVAGEGTDTVISSVTYSLTVTGATPAREVENLTLATGTTSINATGNALANILTGNDGANILDGKAGADTMIGGNGNDTYYVDNAGDVVSETIADDAATTAVVEGGVDTVMASITYSLASAGNVEKLTLTGTANINATGNALNNTITGNTGNNLIDGGAGNDTMTGGLGDDTYVLDSASDKVVENLGQGTDTIRIAATYAIDVQPNIERIELLGTGDFNATGNAANNQLVGNSGNNILDGKAGADTMTGGAGNDTYYVDNSLDVVTEGASAGTDLVVATATFTLGNNVENLTLSAAGTIGGTGNALANTIIGNGSANLIDGAGGADTIDGGAGNDTITGGVGNDYLTGGAGADNFVFSSALNATTNVDTIADFTLNVDKIVLSQTIFTALTTPGTLAANAFVAGTSATTANTRIIYDAATGSVYYDADGTGATAAVKFATIANHVGLTAASFSVTLGPPTLTLAADTGTSATDKITKNGTVNVGGIVAGATWQYSLDGGATWNSGSGTSLTLTGDGDKSVIVKQIDSTGTASPLSPALGFTLDTATPAESVSTVAFSADTGVSATDFITNAAAQTISGTLSTALAAGDVVRISLDNGATWQTATATTGSTSFSLSGVTLTGSNTMIVRVEDVAGNPSASVTQAYVLDTTAPSERVSTVAFSNDTGTSATDFITKTAAQTITGTLSAALATGDVVKVSMDNGATWQTATATVGTTTFSLAGVTLTGAGTMQVRVEDAAGNNSAALSQAYTLDTTAPTEAVSTVAFSADTGTSASDFITKTAAQTITGTLNAALATGDVVKVSMDNGSTWQTATATVGTTTFSLAGVTLSGSNTMIVRVEDVGGNNSTQKSQAYTLDTTAPTEAVSTVSFSADTGTSATDFLTKTTGQTITGTLSAALAAGDVVKVSMDNGLTWQTATATVGTTTFSLAGVTLTGSNTMQVRVEDAAGNNSTAKTQTYTLDTTAPTEAVSTVAFSADTGTSASDFITKTAAQTITGTLNAALATGDVVKVSLDNGATWQTATATVGTTTFSLAGVTLTGAGTMQVRVEDAAGNNSAALSQAYTLDTTAPTEAVSTVAFSADTGTSASDFITKNTDQTITGTLNAALAAGDVVKVSMDNGLTWQTATATVGTTTFSLAGVTLTGAGTMQVRVEDAAGNNSAALSQAYTLDTTAPTEAVSTVAFSADTGTSASDFITKTAAQTITGTLNAALATGDVVKVSMDNGSTWQTATATVGTTTFSLAGVTLTGANTMQVRVEDAAGNNSTAKTQTYTLDTTAPTEAVSTVAFSADTGTSASDFITKTAAQTITGTLNAALATGDVVKVSLDNGATWQTATATVGTTTFSLAGVTLTGAGTMQVRVEDAAGNNSAALSQAYTLDTTAPTEAVSTVAFSADTGTSASDFITKTAAQTISGTLSAVVATGEVVKVSLDNGATWQTATATVGTTTFSLAGVTLTGAGTMQVRVEDAAGNNSAALSQAYTLDTTAPTEAVSTVAFSADTGTSASDFITKTAAQTITGTLNAALATGDVVKVSLDNGATWQTATATVGTTTFSLAGVTLTGAGTMQVRVEDAAGNNSAALSQAYTLDTTAPTEAVSTVAFSADTGTSASDFITKTAAQTITGTLNAALATGDVVKVSLDNGATWQTATATVGTTTFSLAGVTLTGAGTMQVRVEDAAGNNSTALSQAYTLDTTAPTEAVSTVAFSADTGTSASDFITKTAAQTITGTLNAALATGDVVKVSLDNGATWQTATATVGTTTFSLAGVTLTGAGTMQVRVEDAAGNNSAALSQAYTLDTTAPTEAVSTVAFSADTGTSASDFITKTAAQTITGTLNAALATGDVVKVSLDNGATWQTATATVGTTTFSLAGVTLTGAGTMQVRVEDAAGNNSTAKTQTYTLDTTAPTTTVSTVSFSADTGSSTTDFITKTAAQTISGTLSAVVATGEVVKVSLDNGATWQTATATVGTSTFSLAGVTLTGSNTMLVRVEDAAGNAGTNKSQAYVLDTTAPTLNSITSNGTSTSTSETLTIKFSEQVAGFTTSDVVFSSITSGTVTGGTATDTGVVAGIDTWTLTITKSIANSKYTATVANASFTDVAGNNGTGLAVATLLPAGMSGSPINLGLASLAHDGATHASINVLNMPTGWELLGATHAADGSWHLDASALSTAAIVTPTGFAGASVLEMLVTFTHADGTKSYTFVSDNIEAYADGNPIFAWSGDDNLTGSAKADTFVITDPVAKDVIYAFDAAADKVDLVGFAGFKSFADVKAHLADDASGNAVLTLADGKSIEFAGVHASSLTATNFVFDVQHALHNAGHLDVGNGAILPMAGLIDNSGTILLGSTSQESLLQVLQNGLTLTGGGSVVLAESGLNVIGGSGASGTLTNADNTISGAGLIGAGTLAFVNHGTVNANGAHALTIDTGAAAIHNDGVLEASGAGGLVIASGLDNAGKVWANNATVTVEGAATGGGNYLVSGHGIIDFKSDASGRITLADDATATLHFSASGFSGGIAGLTDDDTLILDGLAGGSLALAAVGEDGHTVLTIGNGHESTTLSLLGSYDAAGFSLSRDGAGHAVLSYTAHQHDLIV